MLEEAADLAAVHVIVHPELLGREGGSGGRGGVRWTSSWPKEEGRPREEGGPKEEGRPREEGGPKEKGRPRDEGRRREEGRRAQYWRRFDREERGGSVTRGGAGEIARARNKMCRTPLVVWHRRLDSLGSQTAWSRNMLEGVARGRGGRPGKKEDEGGTAPPPPPTYRALRGGAQGGPGGRGAGGAHRELCAAGGEELEGEDDGADEDVAVHQVRHHHLPLR